MGVLAFLPDQPAFRFSFGARSLCYGRASGVRSRGRCKRISLLTLLDLEPEADDSVAFALGGAEDHRLITKQRPNATRSTHLWASPPSSAGVQAYPSPSFDNTLPTFLRACCQTGINSSTKSNELCRWNVPRNRGGPNPGYFPLELSRVFIARLALLQSPDGIFVPRCAGRSTAFLVIFLIVKF